MNSHTSAGVKGQSMGLVTGIFDGESQMSKEVMRLFRKIYFQVILVVVQVIEWQ